MECLDLFFCFHSSLGFQIAHHLGSEITIIPGSKTRPQYYKVLGGSSQWMVQWLITMVIVSPQDLEPGVVGPLTNDIFMAS